MNSYLRLDHKSPESMPDGMGCHSPTKLREQNSELRRVERGIVGASNTDFHQIHIIAWLVRPIVRCDDASLSLDCDKQGLQSVFPGNLELSSRSQRLTRIPFSCIPHVATKHRGNDCQIRWSVSVGSLFIITVASVSSCRDSTTLLLLPWLPLPPWLPEKFYNKKYCEQTIGTESTIILGCMPRLVVSHGPKANRTQGEARGSATFVAQVFHWIFHRWFEPFHLRISHVILRDVRGGVALMIVHILVLRARQGWPPSLAQLHTVGVLHRATGPTPHQSFATAFQANSNLLSRSSACTPVSMSLTRLARRSRTAVGWTLPMSSVLL